MKLYESAGMFSELFDKFDTICNFEPETNELGEYIDAAGNVIPDINAYRQEIQEAWFDTLDGIEEDFEEKAENIAAFIKSLSAEAEDLKAEESALSKRRKAKENQITYLKAYLIDNMTAIGRKLIDKPKARISLRNNPESVEIANEKEFIKWAESNSPGLLNYKPNISKTAVKEALKNGDNIPGAVIDRKVSVIIK